MIEILMVDDHRALSEGIKIALAQTPDLKVSGLFSDGYSALEYLAQTRELPDLVITDLEMKGMNGLVLLQHLMATYPDLKVMILTQHDHYAQDAFDAGARGYILKDSGIAEIIQAIRMVANGEQYNSLLNVHKMPLTGIPEFTTRELQIIKLIVEEYTTRQIAEKLAIPFSAVETYAKTIRRKTGASNIAGIVKFALRNNLVKE